MENKLFQTNYYVSIYDEMPRRYKISILQAWLLVKIFTLSKNGMSQTKIQTGTLADLAQTDRRTIQRNIKTLLEKNLIVKFVIHNNRNHMTPAPEVCNQLRAWMIENETSKGLNAAAAGN